MNPPRNSPLETVHAVNPGRIASGTIPVPTRTAPTMSIWFQPFTLEEIQGYSRGSMVEHLDLRFTEIGPDFLRGTLPVDSRTTQPFGLLHGGASAVLAETLGSVAATHCVDMSRHLLRRARDQLEPHPVGALAGGSPGRLARSTSGSARRSGKFASRTTKGRLTCISRLTVMVLEGAAQGMAGGRALMTTSGFRGRL